MGSVKESDVVISSFGKHPFELRRKNINESKSQEGAATGVLQAKVDGHKANWDDDGATPPVNESKSGSGEGMGTTTPYRKWMG